VFSESIVRFLNVRQAAEREKATKRPMKQVGKLLILRGYWNEQAWDLAALGGPTGPFGWAWIVAPQPGTFNHHEK